MKEKIISKTILFIEILLFVNIFSSVFGSKNSLVGVSIVIATLVLKWNDLTNDPVKNFLKILATNLILGIAAFIASNNIMLGVVINFITLAYIGYYFSYNLTKAMIVPFGLLYIFMLYNPVYGMDFGKRIGALIFGAVFIMITQYIVHRKKNKSEYEKSEILEYDEEIAEETHAIRLGYAVRVGLLTALTAFITSYFNLEQGRWMTFTIFSLTELYSEHCKVKSKQRLEGTIIGAIIIVVLFMFIKDSTLRTLIMLIAGYLNTFTENYRDAMIVVTVSSVASVALTNGTIATAIERLFYVLIGIGIALIANKFILKSSKKLQSPQKA